MPDALEPLVVTLSATWRRSATTRRTLPSQDLPGGGRDEAPACGEAGVDVLGGFPRVFKDVYEVDDDVDVYAAAHRLVLDALDLVVVAVDEGDPAAAMVRVALLGEVEHPADHLCGTAGESFWATTTAAAQNMYLLEANPSNTATFIQGRPLAASLQHTQVIDGCTLYTAQYTGWHALVIVSDTYPQTTNPGSGIAFGIHAYNSAQPDSCPMADWPNPTP